jgi:repressor LexA
MLDRLKLYIDEKGISIAAFERSIGMSNASFGKSLKNNGAIGSDKLENILRVYPDINPEWLLTGNGEMLVNEFDSLHVKEEQAPYYKKSQLPLIPINAAAGFSSGDDKAILHSDVDFYSVPEFNKKADYLIRVSGSSMYPKYNSGDIVACKKLPLDTFFQWNKVYILDTIQGPLMKRVKKAQDKDYITLVSDNEKYDPFDILRTEIHSLALVIGVIRLE